MDGGLATGFAGGLYSTQAGVSFRTLAGGVGLPIESSGPAPVTASLAVTLAAKTVAATATVTTPGGGGGAFFLLSRRRRTRRRHR